MIKRAARTARVTNAVWLQCFVRSFPVHDDLFGRTDPIGNWPDCMKNPESCDENNSIDPIPHASNHAACAAGCYANPENPYYPSGPNLPDRDVRLF
jgi:hypothetical protein